MKKVDTKQIKNNKNIEINKEIKNRVVISGKVVSLKNKNTLIVEIINIITHPVYKKQLKRSKRVAVHYENVELNLGQSVKITQCRPISKTKHYKLVI